MQVDPVVLSMAAAHGITQRSAATWSPALVRSPRVLVPVELDVLMVRNPQLAWAQTAMTVPTATPGDDTPADAATLLPAPFSELAAARPRGAYLQWYLPGTLRAGTADADGGATFPRIPDRWLVLRISNGTSVQRRAVRGWVLVGDVEPPQVVDLDAFVEPGPATGALGPLTALGYGDLSWAGYFDNVAGRLGFYDGSLDAEQVQGPIAYVACGWYADPTADPLGDQNVTTQAAFDALLAQLGWTLDASELPATTQAASDYSESARSAGLPVSVNPNLVTAPPQPSWPTACVFHGAAVGLDWSGADDATEVGGPPSSAGISVTVGNTMAEAMGALIASASGAPADAPVVEALQLGALSDLDDPDGRAGLDVRRHTSSFASLLGGPPTIEPIQIAPSGPPPKKHVGGVLETTGFDAGAPPEVFAPKGRSFTVIAEETVVSEPLANLIGQVSAGPQIAAYDPGGTFDAMRAASRYFTPRDPIVLIQGGKRSFVHESTALSSDGLVVCRLTPVSELSWHMPSLTTLPYANGADVLERGVENGSVPLECEGILQETVLLDPGSAGAIATAGAASAGATFDLTTARTNVEVEQTVWYALRHPGINHAQLLAYSGFAGTLPAAWAVSPSARPWTPMHLEWTVEYVASPNGVRDWELDQIDYELGPTAVVPAAGTGITYSGRSPVTGGACDALASAVNQALAQASVVSGTGVVPDASHEAFYSDTARTLLAQFQGFQLGGAAARGVATPAGPLQDIATALSQMDVLSCGFDGLLEQLRGALPEPFFAVRAGFLRIVRLRLVDGFGQFIDLCGSDAMHAATGYGISVPLAVDGQPGVLGLPPRFTAPTRAWFRFMSAETPGVEADYETSPICAFILPNHLDGSLEFFNADGSGAGSLQPFGDGTVEWQVQPGTPTLAGQDPGDVLTSPYAAQLARGLMQWGIADAAQPDEGALSALLRTIDSTLWTVDPYGSVGEEHLSLLVGHPICVVRAVIRLDVDDPVLSADGTVTAVPVRLGDLTQWQDGLLGYFAADDYTVLHVADSAAPGMARQVGPMRGFLEQINLVPQYYASFAVDVPAGASTGAHPVTHPYVDTSGVLWIRPNQTIVLTLLVEPMTTVHATLGLVPRKEIGMRRAWVQAGLAAIVPTFRFGPVLLDPQQVRMPIPSEIAGTWVWDYRADAVSWSERPATNSTDQALLSADPATAVEGWLKLEPPAPD